jgi:diadenosine tetraphosphatase ApaH/serine/threonine PP2A family protein phosphatase
MGDFTDRGPDGVGVIDFVMRLQQNAARKGGTVGALLGNHDVGLLSAFLFPNEPTHGTIGTFYGDWFDYGGIPSDLQRLQAHHVEWLRNLPAMARVGDRLLVHADALYYADYGTTVEQVNAATSTLLHGNELAAWDRLLSFAGERFVFDDRKRGGQERAQQFLEHYGGKQLVHGHTPISHLSGEPIERVTRAYMYAGGLAVDVDGGMYKGGAGFVYEAPPLDAEPEKPPPPRVNQG